MAVTIRHKSRQTNTYIKNSSRKRKGGRHNNNDPEEFSQTPNYEIRSSSRVALWTSQFFKRNLFPTRRNVSKIWLHASSNNGWHDWGETSRRSFILIFLDETLWLASLDGHFFGPKFRFFWRGDQSAPPKLKQDTVIKHFIEVHFTPDAHWRMTLMVSIPTTIMTSKPKDITLKTLRKSKFPFSELQLTKWHFFHSSLPWSCVLNWSYVKLLWHGYFYGLQCFESVRAKDDQGAIYKCDTISHQLSSTTTPIRPNSTQCDRDSSRQQH